MAKFDTFFPCAIDINSEAGIVLSFFLILADFERECSFLSQNLYGRPIFLSNYYKQENATQHYTTRHYATKEQTKSKKSFSNGSHDS